VRILLDPSCSGSGTTFSKADPANPNPNPNPNPDPDPNPNPDQAQQAAAHLLGSLLHELGPSAVSLLSARQLRSVQAQLELSSSLVGVGVRVRVRP